MPAHCLSDVGVERRSMRPRIETMMNLGVGSLAAILALLAFGCGGASDDTDMSPEPLVSAPPPMPPGYDGGSSGGPNPCGSVAQGVGEHTVEIPILCAPIEYETTPEPDDIHSQPQRMSALWGDV
jgi:hypothetical protein